MSDKTELSLPTGRPSTTTTEPGAAPELAGYELGKLLGQGGMGLVVSARDTRIDRDVAVKRLATTSPQPVDVERFVREAKIQAQLEHPAIVPVHELGFDGAGLPYFTMKRLTGATMTDKLADGSASTQRLLRAVVDVCNAIGLAHARGVVHRDLKPANVMLGEFGEVYVIDWGVARVLDDAPEPQARPTPAPGAGLTEVGTLIGTPGYMAPEQSRGETAGPPADVYAIGAILFEILAGERLRSVSDGDAGAIESSPARRRADRNVAPELDAACRGALATDPAQRPTARALGDQIQRYLDGDRDLEQRRRLAAAELTAAHAALDSRDPARRADAMRAAGRAMALDPGSAAAELVTQLILTPPDELPAGAVALVDEVERDHLLGNGRRAVVAYGAMLVGVVLATLFVPLRDPWQLALIFGAIAANMAMSRFVVDVRGPIELGASFVLVLVFSRACSPFVLTPVLLAAMMPSLAQVPWINQRPLRLALWVAVAGIAPFAIEWLGLVPATWSSVGDGILTAGSAFDQSGTRGAVAAIASQMAFLIVIAFYNRQAAVDRRLAVEKVHVQNWHLRQLVGSA